MGSPFRKSKKVDESPKPETPVIPPLKPVPAVGAKPVYPKPHKFHPRFEHLLPAPYTHLHPIDVLRSVGGQKEISGSKDNELIAHFHEHSRNLGSHSDTNDYHDEVPHCSSSQNWAADMSGCKKTDHALASSWDKYPGPKLKYGDWVEEGMLVRIAHPGDHITLANKRFRWIKGATFEGFGTNQNNSICTKVYSCDDIVTVHDWLPLEGTVLAPIGILGHKRMSPSGSGGSTR